MRRGSPKSKTFPQHSSVGRGNIASTYVFLQIRILHLRKRREKSFPTAKMFLVLKLRWFKVANLTLMDLVVFRGREQRSLLLKIER